jgi:hypothetical protein
MYTYRPCTQYDNTQCITDICFRTVLPKLFSAATQFLGQSSATHIALLDKKYF